MTTTIGEHLDRARRAHQSIQDDDGLRQALAAGDELIAAKALCPDGLWSHRLASTGIPASTARLYTRLARSRQRVEAAGCTSIRQARRLLSDVKPKARRSSMDGARAAGGSARSDRYDEGYADGYRAGRADAYAAPRRSPGRRRARPSATTIPADPDLLWLVSLAHPDRHDETSHLRALRVTQWLNALRDGGATRS